MCFFPERLENMVGKEQNNCHHHFLLFHHFSFFVRIYIKYMTKVVWQRDNPALPPTRKGGPGTELTLSQTSPCFSCLQKNILKTLWEKEKLLVTSNFSFFPIVLYPNGELSAIFIKFEIAVCNWMSPKFVVWERVKWWNQTVCFNDTGKEDF